MQKESSAMPPQYPAQINGLEHFLLNSKLPVTVVESFCRLFEAAVMKQKDSLSSYLLMPPTQTVLLK